MKRLTIIPNLDKLIIDYRFENEIQEITEYVNLLYPDYYFWLKDNRVIIAFNSKENAVSIEDMFFKRIIRFNGKGTLYGFNYLFNKIKIKYNVNDLNIHLFRPNTNTFIWHVNEKLKEENVQKI